MLPRTLRFLAVSRSVKATTQPFYSGDTQTAPRHILVVGDSTMYGAGATSPDKTLGGLLAAHYPGASIETVAENGARVRDLAAQLSQARCERYDLIIIGVGGNDIVRLSRYSVLRRQLRQILERVSNRAETVVLLHSLNIGNTGFFIFPLNRLFDYRTQQLSLLYQAVVQGFSNVIYLNTYRPAKSDYYTPSTRPQFLAADGYHPSDYATEFFFQLILKAIASHNLV